MFSVFIRQAEQAVNVEVGSTILETALAAGIDYPHGCRAGNCGGCKSRIHFGEVELSPYSEFALSDEEYADDLILACRAVPWSDCEVSWCELDDIAVHPVRDLQCRVTDVEKLTSDIASVKLNIQSGGPFTFSSGQFVYITFEGYPRREYSIASHVNDTLEFYIRRIEGGIVSPFVWDHLEAGEMVQVEGPHGNMFYREIHDGPVLVIAGGSGLSAIQPIALEAIQKHPDRAVYLYHGVRDESDIYRTEIFQSLDENHHKFQYIPVLSSPTDATEFRTGMLSKILENDFKQDSGFKAYLAGPPPMVRSCTDVLRKLGVDQTNIHADPFFTEADQGR